ncbi:MAG: dihydroorotate dehydrogenase electron transfer subunit [Firmicutes bacterium]|nr:dihydroorotate dehydrogenase electron transfer subunit [Bacillota bacterium]
MKDILFTIADNCEIAEGIYRLELTCGESLPPIIAGQFLHLEVPDKRLLMRRPFCIYDYKADSVITYYVVVGKGTYSLSRAQAGDKLRAILPLGNGFDVSGYKKIALLGGGMGCAELYSVTKTEGKEFYAYLGFANKRKVAFLEDFERKVKRLNVFTDDGSYGEKGFALPALLKDIAQFDAVLACGPTPMLKALQGAVKDIQLPVFASLEQRMGCGVGACLACTCKVKENGEVRHKRVCADGPVFDLRNVIL